MLFIQLLKYIRKEEPPMNENNITRLAYHNKEIILLGTAHVSKQSAIEVAELISLEKPNSVCIELDEQRYESLTNPKKWQDTDIIKIIKEKRVFLLLVNIILSSYQRKIAVNLDTTAGKEMIQAIDSAKENNATLVLADRSIQITFSRIWRKHSFIEKIKLLYMLIFSSFNDEKITEEDLEKLKQEDVLEAALSEISEALPTVAEVLIDERNQYLANKIKNAPGPKIVAVLGAAHIPGITKEIYLKQDMKELRNIPKKTLGSKIVGWLIPILIIGIFVYSFLTNTNLGFEQLKSWILYNGTFSAIGCIILMAHPLTILTAFIAAPFTSLNPLLAVGWFAGLVEALIRKPTVNDLENIYKDITSLKGILKNRFIKVLAIVLMANLFSTIATFISGIDIIERLFSTL